MAEVCVPATTKTLVYEERLQLPITYPSTGGFVFGWEKYFPGVQWGFVFRYLVGSGVALARPVRRRRPGESRSGGTGVTEITLLSPTSRRPESPEVSAPGVWAQDARHDTSGSPVPGTGQRSSGFSEQVPLPGRNEVRGPREGDEGDGWQRRVHCLRPLVRSVHGPRRRPP